MTENLNDKPYYFLHTLVGSNSQALDIIMDRAGRPRPSSCFKIGTLLAAYPESPEGIVKSFGWDLREVICTVSGRQPAITYHNNYGLVLDGIVKACFDNDSGCRLQDDGTYDDPQFDFTNLTTLEALTGRMGYTDKPSISAWNEVILAKGSVEVVGAFLDPSKPPKFPELRNASGLTCREEYNLFLEKVRRCGLGMLHIDASS